MEEPGMIYGPRSQKPVLMLNSAPSKRSFFSVRKSSDDVKPSKIPRPHDIDLFRRATSALANHRIHQLSDIREVSSSSKTATLKKRPSILTTGTKDIQNDLPSTPQPQRGLQSESEPSEYATPANNHESLKTPIKGLSSRATSTLSLPMRDVPERRSSASIFAQSLQGSRRPSLQELPKWRIPPASSETRTVQGHGRSDSPVRQALERAAQSSEAICLSPSRTFIRTTPPLDILDKGGVRHDRLQMSIHLPSPLFVGGGTIEGQICLEADKSSLNRKTKPKPMGISRLSIDVIGVEEVNDGRRWVFLSLGTELFDSDHPPPPSLVHCQRYQHGSELSWIFKPGTAIIPFCLNLPLNLGPPPYLSKQACIRYLLVPTAYIQTGERRSLVRQTWNIQMLTVYDPEKALASLPSPLLAADSLVVSQTPELQDIKLTAGLHRQTWVNGGKIFVDLHVVNRTAKTIKKIEVQLEKTTLWYTHAAAGTIDKSASHLRLPKRSDIETIGVTSIKKSRNWKGITPHSSEVRTCELDVPRGHVTVSTGRYFEVRFFVNVLVFASRFKNCAVQLPVTLIHMNSLDILPNSLAQVAASIEAKRAKTVPISRDISIHQQYYSGQAFAAPRRQSLDRACAETGVASKEVSILSQELDKSPRRYGSVHDHHHRQYHRKVLGTSGTNENLPPRPSNASAAHNHHKHHPSCYHCHLVYNEHGERPPTAAPQIGPKLPRLQVSTSGLGFSESEFEIPADSPPRKVMLSEQERKMINQQKELKLQREYSHRKRKESFEQSDVRRRGHPESRTTWRNVAADLHTMPLQPPFGHLNGLAPPGPKMDRRKGKEPVRGRSRTNPDRLTANFGPLTSHKGVKSVDSSYRVAPVNEMVEAAGPARRMSKRSVRGGPDSIS